QQRYVDHEQFPERWRPSGSPLPPTAPLRVATPTYGAPPGRHSHLRRPSGSPLPPTAPLRVATPTYGAPPGRHSHLRRPSGSPPWPAAGAGGLVGPGGRRLLYVLRARLRCRGRHRLEHRLLLE